MAIKINNNTIINDSRAIVDIYGNVGAGTSVLSSTGTAIQWKTITDLTGETTTKGFVYFSVATV